MIGTILLWIGVIIILTFIGYVINRILFWTGSFISKYSDNVILYGRFWFYKGTTIKDICNKIKYSDGYDHNNDEYYNDLYYITYLIRWVPMFNIFYSVGVFLFYIIKFIFALLIVIIRLIILFYYHILWNCFLKYIYKLTIYILDSLYWILKKIKFIDLCVYLGKVYQKITHKILNFKIA